MIKELIKNWLGISGLEAQQDALNIRITASGFLSNYDTDKMAEIITFGKLAKDAVQWELDLAKKMARINLMSSATREDREVAMERLMNLNSIRMSDE